MEPFSMELPIAPKPVIVLQMVATDGTIVILDGEGRLWRSRVTYPRTPDDWVQLVLPTQ